MDRAGARARVIAGDASVFMNANVVTPLSPSRNPPLGLRSHLRDDVTSAGLRTPRSPNLTPNFVAAKQRKNGKSYAQRACE